MDFEKIASQFCGAVPGLEVFDTIYKIICNMRHHMAQPDFGGTNV